MKKRSPGNRKQPAEIDIYNLPRRLSDARRRISEDPKVSKRNRELIFLFDDHLKRQQLSGPYRDKCLNVMRNLAQLSDTDFDRYTRKDAEMLMDKIIDSERWGKEWKYHMMKTFKTFFKHMKDAEDMPAEVKWIKPTKQKNPQLNPNDLLSIDDIKTMADGAANVRDRAFIKVLWESGCRIGEFLTMRLRDVEEVEDGCFLNITKSKTDLRKVFVYYFYPDLKDWLNRHPRKNDNTAPLWPNLLNGHQGDPVCYRAAMKLFMKAVKRAGIQGKKTNLHSVRHSSISYFVHSNKFTESEIKYKYWGNPATQQLSRYAHLDPYRIADKIRGKRNKQEIPEPQGCPNCGTLNDGLNDTCWNCHKSLKYSYKMNKERALLFLTKQFMQYIEKNPKAASEMQVLMNG